MNVWKDMARDAGYRGDEADQVARMLEEEERERQFELDCMRREQFETGGPGTPPEPYPGAFFDAVESAVRSRETERER